ncbi:DUF3017 domain-containing protein [Bifidobacterium aemilianum]|uniref:DUF3017 domain-containing protein n=2 Tax=Bifidobacterium aemilianum TaxID=2493120 RepID=A0A366K9J8_9BIFI|nr:DUF3017 domain-containing protein [Bifidobacterium aemilianum]
MVAVLVVIATLLALLKYVEAATMLIAVTALVLGVLRLVLGDTSPWKVRSRGFDAFICIGLGLGLILTYLSIGQLS